jgi:hypothetical protein
VVRTIRAGVLRLPRRAGARLGLTAEQVRELDAECRAVLTELGSGAAFHIGADEVPAPSKWGRHGINPGGNED